MQISFVAIYRLVIYTSPILLITGNTRRIHLNMDNMDSGQLKDQVRKLKELVYGMIGCDENEDYNVAVPKLEKYFENTYSDDCVPVLRHYYQGQERSQLRRLRYCFSKTT